MESIQQNTTEHNTPRYTTAQWYAAKDAMYHRCLRYVVALENTGKFSELDATLDRAVYNEYQRPRPLAEQVANLQALCVMWEIALPEDCNDIPV